MFRVVIENKWIFDIAPSGKRLFIFKCILSIFADMMLVLYPVLFGKMIDAIFYKDSWSLFIRYILIYISVFFLNQIANILITKLDIKTNLKFTNNIKKALFGKYISAKAVHFYRINSVDVINIINIDVENVIKFYDEVILTSIRSYFYIGVSLVIIMQYSWEINIAVLIFALLTVYLADAPKKKFQAIKKEYRKEYGDFLSWVMETLNGMQDIRVNCAEDIVSENFRNYVLKLLKSKEKARFIEIKAERINVFFTALFTLAFWTISAIFVVNRKITIGAFFAIEKYFATLIANIDRIKQAKIDYHNYHPSFDKISDLYKCSREELGYVEEKKFYTLKQLPLTFTNVAFKYTDRFVIKNLNLSINKGEFLSIVGANGEGKSTILGLISKFYDVEYGSIKLGDYNINDISSRQLRNQIGYVQQNSIIFEGTLEDNLRMYKNNVTEEEMWDALKRCKLYDTVVGWQDGLKTNLMNGDRLSGGQKQRISFARTLLKNPQIILLDEPTSSLDSETELLIVNELRHIFEGKILIMVSHRAAAIQVSDRIAVLHGGEFTDVGTNEELMKRCQIYRQLFLNSFEYSEVKKHEIS